MIFDVLRVNNNLTSVIENVSENGKPCLPEMSARTVVIRRSPYMRALLPGR